MLRNVKSSVKCKELSLKKCYSIINEKLNEIVVLNNKFTIIHLGRVKQFLLYKKLFGRVNDNQLPNEYVLHNFLAFYQALIIKSD